MIPAAPVPHVCRPHRHPSWLERAAERLVAPFVAPILLLATVAAWAVSRFYAVGVVVETTSRPAPSDIVSSPGAGYFVAGITERGDIAAPVEIRSLADYVDRLGNRVAYGALYDDLSVFFAEGGTRAHVARIVGGAATKGTLTLNDRAGAPVATLRLDATSVGAWSTRVKVAVADGAVANTFSISVLLDDAVVELYPNLATPADAVSALGQSRYVRAVNLASATVAPANNPAVAAAAPLSAGTDDRGAIVAADYVTGLARFGPELGPGIVAVPGQTAANVGAGLIAHAKARSRLAILAPAVAQTPTQAKTATVAFLGSLGSEHAGVAYPWVQIDDGAGSVRTISPEGYVAAVRARAHRQAGPWRAPAGQIARARMVVNAERVLTRAEIDDLNDNQVIPVAVIAGAVELYGWRSLSLDLRNFRLLTGRDTMNEVAALGAARLEPYVFGTVDSRGHFQEELAAELRAILEPMQSAGGLYERVDEAGAVLSPAYSIDTSAAVNTDEVLAADEVRVDVALRVSPTGELIRLRITKVAFDSAL